MKNLKKLFLILSLVPSLSFSQNTEDLKETSIQIDSVEYANKVDSSEPRRQLIIGIMNDVFTPNSTDRHLTNEIKVGYITDKLPSFLDWYTDDFSEHYYVATISQQMYTPEDIEQTDLIEEDRPFAGWTYLTFAVAKRKDRNLEMTVLDVGIIGEESLAEDVQIAWHDFIDTREPRGWDNQLETELGLNLSHARAANFRIEDEQFVADLTPFVIGSIGNVKTALTVGATARVGINVPDDILLGYENDFDEDETRFYAFATLAGTYVARDIFLDGNTFDDSHSVDKRDWVSRASIGVAYKFGNFELSYSYGITSEQFYGQDGYDKGGLFLLNFKKKF